MRRLCRGFKPHVPHASLFFFFFFSSFLSCPHPFQAVNKAQRPPVVKKPTAVQQMANGAAFEGLVRSFASPATSTLDLAALKKGGHKRAQVKRKRRNSRQHSRVRTHEEVATRATCLLLSPKKLGRGGVCKKKQEE